MAVWVLGRDHTVIHPDVPVVPNFGYLVGGRLFHPMHGNNVVMPVGRSVLKTLRAKQFPVPEPS